MEPLLQYVDAVTVPVPDLDRGMAFYRDVLGHQLIWRNEAAGQAGLRTPGSRTEIVLTTRQSYEPDWKVASADGAAEAFAVGAAALICDAGWAPGCGCLPPGCGRLPVSWPAPHDLLARERRLRRAGRVSAPLQGRRIRCSA